MILGGGVWVWASDPLLAADGSTGLSLFSARISVATGLLLLAVAGIPAIAMGVAAACLGNPLAGVFTVAACLVVLAASAGGIDGWMWRSDLPGSYVSLLAETMIWQIALVLLWLVIHAARSRLRRASAGADTATGDAARHGYSTFAAAALLSAAVASPAALVLIRDSHVGQVLGGLFLAFMLGAIVTAALFPRVSPLAVLCSPALSALACYGWVLLNYSNHHEVLAAWHLHENGILSNASRALPGLALALPIHFFSAGVAGCCLGLGMGEVTRNEERGPHGALMAFRQLLGESIPSRQDARSAAPRKRPRGKK